MTILTPHHSIAYHTCYNLTSVKNVSRAPGCSTPMLLAAMTFEKAKQLGGVCGERTHAQLKISAVHVRVVLQASLSVEVGKQIES